MAGEGGLKVGDLYIAATASIGPALKSLGKLVDACEKAAREVKNAGNDLGEIGAFAAAGIAAAVAAAAQSNEAMKQEVERITDLLYTLAADLGDLFAPVVQRVSEVIETLVATLQSLSPEQKQAAASLVTWVAGVGLAAGTVGKLAGVVEALAGTLGLVTKVLGALNASTALAALAGGLDKVTKALGGVTRAAPEGTGAIGRLALSFGTLLVPLAAVAAAVAAVVLLAGSIYGAWTDASTGLRDSVMSILRSIGEAAAKLWEVLTGAFAALTEVLKAMALRVLDDMAALVRGVSKVLAPVAEGAGYRQLAGTLREASNLTGEQLLKDITAGASLLRDSAVDAAGKVWGTLRDAGKETVDFVGYGLSKSAAGVKKLVKDTGLDQLPAKVSAILANLLPDLGGGKARVRQSASRKEEAEKQRQELEKFNKELAALNAAAAEESHAEFTAAVRAEEAQGAAAFREMRLQAEALAQAAEQAMADARASLTERFASAFGQLNDLVGLFGEGTLAAGGTPLGGVAAVVGELLTQSEAFQTLMEMVSVIIQRVADALGKLLEPLQPLLGAISLVIDAVLSALTPIFELLGQVLQPLVPPLVVIGQLLQGLAPLLEVVGKAFLAIMAPLQVLAGPTLKALFEVLKFVSVIILTVAKALGSVWNAIVGAVQSVIRAISKAVEWLGIDALKNFANSMDRLKVDTDAMGEALHTLRDTTWDSANATAQNTAETLRNAEAQRRANEALSNVPSAWKVAHRRFLAQDAQQGPPTAPTQPPAPTPTPTTGGSRPPSRPLQPVPGPPTAPNDPDVELPDYKDPRDPRRGPTWTKTSAGGDVYSVNIVGYDIDEAVKEGAAFVERQRAALNYRSSGRPLTATTKYA